MPAKLCPVTLLISLQYLEVENFHRERQKTKHPVSVQALFAIPADVG